MPKWAQRQICTFRVLVSEIVWLYLALWVGVLWTDVCMLDVSKEKVTLCSVSCFLGGGWWVEWTLEFKHNLNKWSINHVVQWFYPAPCYLSVTWNKLETHFLYMHLYWLLGLLVSNQDMKDEWFILVHSFSRGSKKTFPLKMQDVSIPKLWNFSTFRLAFTLHNVVFGNPVCMTW